MIKNIYLFLQAETRLRIFSIRKYKHFLQD